MLVTQAITYHDKETILEGYCAHQDIKTKKPAVLVCHDWSGKNEFACHQAERLAELGYVGFALDMYGKGKIGQSKDEKMALMQPFMQDRTVLLQRIAAALTAIKTIDGVDPHRVAAIGFCFGGLCVLDLARSNAALKGVVSFHGLLQAPDHQPSRSIQAKILALHGFDDPMVTADQVVAFGEEMTQAKADWQLYMYGNTMHAFTNPEANDPEFGTVYNKQTAQRAWASMVLFFQEIFGVC